jgi:hypothetical protein
MELAEFHHSKVRLGKQPHKHDDRTLRLARYFDTSGIVIPENFDFDAKRKPFPVRMWGNDQYGDCVIAAEANGELRLERVETWQTVPIVDADAINRYKLLTGCKEAGDENDTGLVILDAMRNWRKLGFLTAYKERDYKIDAYGELDTHDPQQLREGIYLLHGIHFGFALPAAAQEMTNNGVWDYKGETGSEWEPGSWGGHCVYAKKYTPESIYVLTWGMEIEVTNAFVHKYADEAWGVVDSLDAWRKTGHFNVDAMESDLSQISTKVNQ